MNKVSEDNNNNQDKPENTEETSKKVTVNGESVDDKSVNNKSQEHQETGGFFSDTLMVLVQALLLALVVRTFLFQPFNIPSGSMMPTLLVGDYLFVSKYSYGYSKYSFPYSPDLFEGRIWETPPKRGDVIVFKYTRDPSIDYIKRLIGLPGDRIKVENSVIYINDVPVKREKKGVFVSDDEQVDDEVPIYIETLPNGVTYETLDTNPNGVGDNTRVFEVPEGHYFFMGDNRDNSADSRFDLGYVPEENLIGRAEVVFFSVANDDNPLAFWNWPSDMRTNRFIKGL